MKVPAIMTVARVLRDAGLQQRVLRRQSGGLSPAPAHMIPTEGLEFRDPEVRVWFFDVLLGAFDPRTQQSVEPIAPSSGRG